MILDGTILRDKGIVRMKSFVGKLGNASSAVHGAGVPHLVIVQVGDRRDSNVYVAQKIAFGEKIGVKVTRIRLPEDTTQKALEKTIEEWSDGFDVHGVILQLPIPRGLDATKAIEKIDPRKDVDGLTSVNTKTRAIMPATARGILALLDYYKIPIAGKHAVIVGRSKLVGIPTALSLLDRNATVTIAHSKTKTLDKVTAKADIVILATGKARFFTKKYFAKGQTVIDVGISATGRKGAPKETLSGDARFDEVKKIVKNISPVPGGVGPMTVVSLFENLLDAYGRM